MEQTSKGDRRIEVFTAGGAEYRPDVSCLVAPVSRGELDPQVGWRGDWRQVADTADALIERHTRGKVVLDTRDRVAI